MTDHRFKVIKYYLAGLTGILLLAVAAARAGQRYELPQPSYSSAVLERAWSEERSNHPIIINRMKKVNGVVLSDEAQWLAGKLIRQLYRLPPGQSSATAFEFYVADFEQAGVRQLFSCSSFSCGESNFWANDVFEIPVLYGQNRQQHYFIGEKQGTYYSVYTVKRGNGRIYALVDVFAPGTPKQADDSVSSNQLNRYGYQDIALEQTDIAVMGQSILLPLLQQNPSLQLLLQFRSPVPADMAAFDQQSRKLDVQGQKLLEQLVNAGINRSRLRRQVIFTPGTDAAATVLRIIRIP